MNRRLMLKQISALAALWAVAPVSFAQKAEEYEVLEPVIPSETPGKIEVLEFFHYGCNHCRAFDPLVEEWKTTLPDDVVFRRIPAIWGKPYRELARLYFTEERTGNADKLHEAAFTAIQDNNLPLYTEEGVREWLKGFDIDSKAFMDVYKSFAVESLVKRAEQTARAYKVSGVPMMAVGGQFSTSASKTGSHRQTLKVVDELIVRVREEQKKS